MISTTIAEAHEIEPTRAMKAMALVLDFARHLTLEGDLAEAELDTQRLLVDGFKEAASQSPMDGHRCAEDGRIWFGHALE